MAAAMIDTVPLDQQVLHNRAMTAERKARAALLSLTLEDRYTSHVEEELKHLTKDRQINAYLLGEPGMGKSSFLTSVCSQEAGRLLRVTDVMASDKTVTKSIKGFRLKELPNVSFIDTPGLDTRLYNEVIIRLLLTDQLPQGVNLDKSNWHCSAASAQSEAEEPLRVVLVTISANQALCLGDTESQWLTAVTKVARALGYPVLYLLTKCDLVDPTLKTRPTAIAKSGSVINAICRLQATQGCRFADIVPIINIKDDTSVPVLKSLILCAIRSVCRTACDSALDFSVD